MIIAGQVRAVRALLGPDQRGLTELAGFSIQRMEASDGVIGALIGAWSAAGTELIGGAVSGQAGRGVLLAATPPQP